MSYNVANFDQTVHSEGVQGTVQVSDGNLGFEGSNGVTINSLGDITANAFFGYTSGGGGEATPSLQAVTVVGASTNQAITISNSLTVSGNLFVTGNLVSVDTENLIVQDPIIQLANNSTSDTANVGIIFTRPTSNIVIAYRGYEDEFMIGFSTNSASGTELDPLDDNKLNLKVYGNVEATGLYLGNANLLSNIVNSDIGPGTYGSSTQVPQIIIDSDHRITSITPVSIAEGESIGTLQDVSDTGNTTSNTVQFTNPDMSFTASGNVEVQGYYLGNANLLSNIVNSDVGPATYGNTTHVTQITVTDSGRISSISNVEIRERSNLDQVVNRSNVTSNTIEVGGLVVTNNIHGNYFIGNANLLSNIVNSDITPGTYGSGTQIPQIVIGSDHRVTSITTVPNSGGDVGSLQDVSDTGNTTSNTIQFTNPTIGLVVTGNVEVQGLYTGNANLLSNIVNSDVGPAVYGNTTHVTQITVTDNGRISQISNVEIQERSNLDQVVNRGNVTSNIVTFGGIISTSNIEAPDIIYDSTTSILTIDGGSGGYVARSLQPIKFSENVSKGHPIYISGIEGDHLLGSKADESDSSKMPAIGLSLYDYNTNDIGYVIRLGEIIGVNISSIFTGTTPVANKVVYIGTNGNLTIDRPTGSHDLIQNMGIISKKTGSSVNILIQGAGRSNDTPNRIVINDANIHQVVTIGGGEIRPHTNLYVTGNVYADIYEGNANLLSNIVNSDVGPATYGNTTHITQITISDTGRITGISNVEIQELSNLDQIVNRGNVTSNTVQFTNTETSLITSGNVYINGVNPYASLNVSNPTTSNVIYVQSQTTSNALISFVNTQTFIERGNEYPSLGCSGNDLVFYPGVPRDLAVTISANKNMTVVGNVEVHGLYLGNANLLSNIVNSDVGPATYGNTTHVTQITISDTGRITGVSNVEIQELSNLDQVVNRGNVTSNTVQFTNPTVSLVATGNVEVQGMYLGNANLLSNIVNSDVGPATYGNTTHVTQITISDTGRITGVSNVEIQELSNLDQVVNRGNVTSNSIQVSGIVATGQANVANIVVSQAIGAGPTVSSNIITVDQAGHSYKFFRVLGYPTGSLEGITIQNTTDGCQTLVDIHPVGGDLDVFENFSNGGAGPTVLTSLNSNLVINTGNHVMIACVTDLSNTFVNIMGYYNK